MDFSPAALKRALRAIPVIWGRLADRQDWIEPNNPQANPDETDANLGEHFHDVLNNFATQAAADARDFSHLFKSAAGIQNNDTGDFTDAQLTFGESPEQGDAAQLAALAYQYDHLFDPPYGTIIRKLSRSGWWHGRFIGEIAWQRMEDADSPYPGLIFASNIYDRDPAEYLINPGGHPPGLYRKNHAYSTAQNGDITRMDDARFLWWAWDPVFENPYGTSMNQPLVWPEKTWEEVWKAWRLAAEKGGTGVWWGKYPEKFAGNDAKSIDRRDKFFEMMLNMGQQGAGIFHKDMEIESGKMDIEWQVYESLHNAFIRMVSLRWLGSETALAESKYGTYSAKEKEERGISDLQKYDALWWGAGMQKFNHLFCHFNWARVPVVPKLQLVPLELVTPITPKDQLVEGQDAPQPQAAPQEFQAKEEEDDITPPVAIPAGYESFPNDAPLADNIRSEMRRAKDALAGMPIIRYEELTPEDGGFVLSVKRFRNYTSDMLPLLKAMKDALMVTLDAESEKAAWESYYNLITPIFAASGINMTPQIRNDLNISFRQTRQNVFGEALYQQAIDDPEIVGLRLKKDPSVEDRHLDEIAWDDVAIPIDHPELQQDGRLRIPLNFGCMHTYEPVYFVGDLTPESQWPAEFPGETYKYYAVQGGQE